MTILEIMKKLADCGDITVYECECEEGTAYDVTVEDFEGFDSRWNEIDREFVNEDLLDDFLDTLNDKAKSIEGDYYCVYHFDGFRIELGYASYDI